MSMQGKVVVITGANSGIGKETGVAVATQGATTVLACRNQQKAAEAAAEVKERSGNQDVQLVALDLADLASVRAAASEILDRWDRLDVLINNAGGVWTERQQTAQGFEQTFGVNHLAHFFLTDLLRARLTASAPARIINVSSAGHHMAQRGMRFEDLQTEQRYAGMEVYARSKLANVLFTRQLSDRISATGVTVNALHPGLVRSGFGMDGDMTGLMGWGNRALRPFEISSTAGARTSVFLATSPEVEGKSGLYWVRSKPGHMSRMARRDDQALRLWAESERLLASAGFPAGP